MDNTHDAQEVKVVFIGESGCGKSTIIRHLAKQPDELRYASSIEGHAGTTKVTVEYIFGAFEAIEVDSVQCNAKALKGSDFEAYLNETYDMKELDRANDEYEEKINELAKTYLKEKTIEDIFKEINKTNTAFHCISLNTPVNANLYSEMQKNDICLLRAVDTRGLGDGDNIERIIPFARTDAIVIVGKNTPPNPHILDGLNDVCKKYSYVPVLFVGTHSVNEDEINVQSTDEIETYVSELVKYNKTRNSPIRSLYADVCSEHLDLIEPIRDIMEECRINHIPYIRSLTVAGAEVSKYYKFYVPACIQTFSNCINTISSYQVAQKDVLNRLSDANNNELFDALYNKESLEKVIDYLSPDPTGRYKWHVDFDSVASGLSYRHGSSLDYSYSCVAATLYSMLKSVISDAHKNGRLGKTKYSNDIFAFLLNRVLQHNSSNWYWGYDNGYYYIVINGIYQIVRDCKSYLNGKQLSLNSVICKRFGNHYDSYLTIKILLFEHSLKYLLNKINSDIDVNKYFVNSTSDAADNQLLTI